MDACICKKGLSVAMRLLYSRTGFQKRIGYIHCSLFSYLNVNERKYSRHQIRCRGNELQDGTPPNRASYSQSFMYKRKTMQLQKNSCKPSKLQPRIDTCEMVKKRKPGIERSRNSHGRVPHSRKRDISIMTTLCDSMKLRARFWSELLKLLRYKCL